MRKPRLVCRGFFVLYFYYRGLEGVNAQIYLVWIVGVRWFLGLTTIWLGVGGRATAETNPRATAGPPLREG
jgi:hypothetical protein